MGLGGILQRLKTEGVLLTYIDYRAGSFYDWSGSSRPATAPTANALFTKKGLQCVSNASTITNDATLQATTIGTLIIRQKLPATVAPTPYLARKGTQFSWARPLNFNRYEFTGGGVTVTLALTHVGMFTHAVEFDNAGGTPKGYLDGAFLGNYSGGVTVAGVATNLSFGYLSTTGDRTNVEYFLFISRKLTAAEHAELYLQLQTMSWPNSPYKRAMVPIMSRYNDTNMLFRYSGKKRDGKYLDSTVNANNSTATVNTSAGEIDAIQTNDANSYVASPITGATLDPSAANLTMSVFGRFTTPAVNYAGIFGKGVIGAWTQNPAGGILTANAIGGVYGSWFDGAAYQNVLANLGTLNKRHHIAFVMDNANDIAHIYADGVLAQSKTPLNVNAATIYAAEAYKIGNFGSNITHGAVGAHVKDPTLWSRALSAADVRKEWLQYAQMVQFRTDWGCKESVINDITGTFVGSNSSPLEILSGLWALGTDVVNGEIHKVIRCVASGGLWLDSSFFKVNNSESAYGSWRLVYKHVKGTGTSRISLVSSIKGSHTTVGNTGYLLTLSDNFTGDRLSRYNTGVLTTVLNMPDSLKPVNMIQITRRFDGSWQGYETTNVVHDPQVTAPWAPSVDGPVVDTTYTNSIGMYFALRTGDWISLGTVRGDYGITKFLGEFDPREV